MAIPSSTSTSQKCRLDFQMDGKGNITVRSNKNLDCPINPTATASSSSSFPSSPPPDFLRRVQAALKRHRPIGTIQSSKIKPRRMLVPQRGETNFAPKDDLKSQDVVSLSQDHSEKYSISQSKSSVTVVGERQEDEYATQSSLSGVTIKTADHDVNPRDAHKYHSQLEANCKDQTAITSLYLVSQQGDGQKQVQLSAEGADDRMATGLENLSSHLSSLALTEIDWAASDQLEASTIVNREMKNQNVQNTDAEISFRSDGGVTSLMPKRTTVLQDQMQQFRNFGHLPTQTSVVGPSCATTTSIYSAPAPMHNSTTCYSHGDVDLPATVEKYENLVVNPHSKTQGVIAEISCASIKDSNRISVDQTAVEVQGPKCATDSKVEIKEYHLSKEQKCGVPKETGLLQHNSSILCDNSSKGKESGSNANNPQPQVSLSKSTSTDQKLESSKMERQEKAATKNAAAPRKKGYDPDMFFKVNGKLYQRLGKIGSGGSSEVHKVISSDCTIYALKKIKLKGRDYATAYGFCQEIEYLSRLKGKDHIIQLIDYEVTDKDLLQEVMKGSLSNKDGRVKDDGYIYMVLEYGEIDLAHMLSQKWKELDGCNQTIDENWLRFYWQQILQAVNTIHEERIVHSDLKPANFLLVKGSLKLIDFGIAKAIMSDTTNIQRDSQVGTLSYMSPEAFMCNEKDANGNVIKCGRPSDIWSLGCILYQMVYGRTPFSMYKTFWAKLKVITDPNHEITYEIISNPWLLDLMKKCLAWDRNERWRIPQLLKHPFLVPPVPSSQLPQTSSCHLLQLLAESCGNDAVASKLCCELQQMFFYPQQTLLSSESQNQWCLCLSQISKLSYQLQERLRNSEK